MKIDNIYTLIFLLIALLISSGLIVFIVLQIFKYLKSIKITNEDGNIILKAVGKKTKEKYLNCFNKFCDSRKWIMNITRIINIYSEMYKIDSMFIMEQMNFIENRLIVLRGTDKNLYIDLLKKFTKIDMEKLVDSDPVITYINCLYYIYNELKLHFRSACLENHFLEKNDKEWLEYKENKLDYFLTEMNKDFDASYTANLTVPIYEIKKYYKIHFRNKIKDYLSELLDGCRKIAKNNDEKKKKYEIELEKITKEICGIEENK